MTLFHFNSVRAFVRAAAGISLAVLAACASPPSRFYTLGSDGGSTPADSTLGPAILIDMRPVKVPAAVARSQLVVQANATQVNVLEDDRWASPLADEIRNAMLTALSRQSGAVDVHGMARADNLAVYDVSVDVQRFEAWPGSHVLIDVIWTVRPSNSQETLTCHSIVSQPVAAGYDAIVDGHRHAIGRIAAQIAEGAREFSTTSKVHPIRIAATPGTTRKAPLSCPSLVGGSDAGTGAPVSGAAR
ncbi:membrane integrity-associated transporter subunit PqiC [Paraburkholderia panacisoli]|uniref:Membrane integrity-associated transporter subunit PqiC n=1 Tax=Paraburkholderia panacisoli TaxID=2603818 RepID=A0A5B0G870_9BURK|nr:PqiC family protein [Paraburkholderia panacisoli]KAA0998801.1 membrane integrity-associated transporter subunit PqiC [Paraburkholderia panacisoli]